MKQIKRIVVVSLGFLLLSCSSKMETPAYIYIEDVDFYVADSNRTKQGTASFKIPDIWVTVNGKGIGAYQLPALVPVIANGKTDLIIEAGFKMNGQSDLRPKHPLFTLYKETVNLTKGKIDTIFPVFTYLSYVVFPFKEDFESAGLNFYAIEGSAKLEKTNDPQLLFCYKNEPNNFSGIITLPYSDSIYFFEIQTNTHLFFNSNSVMDCIAELNYFFDANVEIGMYCYFPPNSSFRTQQIPIANIVGRKENNDWNKIYVNLTDEMRNATLNGMTHFDIYMKCGIHRDSTARFLFDNIKVVHR
jgi:hypothetical protein